MVDFPLTAKSNPVVAERCIALSALLHGSAIGLAVELGAVLASAPPAPHINISLQGVDFIGSSILSALVAFNAQVKSKGGELRLSHINQQVYEVFMVTKLNLLFAGCCGGDN